MARQLSRTDHLIRQFDTVLRMLVPGAAQAARPSPALHVTDDVMSEQERQHSAGLMRVNHSGAVRAQALYQGQSLTARIGDVRIQMADAASAEFDHVAWCAARIEELDGHTSYLNPLFYMSSFAIGAVTGRIDNEIGLGFVNASEELVAKQLEDHMTRLPMADKRSRAVIEKMVENEAHHAHNALEAGGKRYSLPSRLGIRLATKLINKAVYRI